MTNPVLIIDLIGRLSPNCKMCVCRTNTCLREVDIRFFGHLCSAKLGQVTGGRWFKSSHPDTKKHLRFAGAFFVSLFQVDNDNPVGAAGAVDGSGAGIFEDIDAFDIVGVNPF